jgi:hypothetical protein
MLVDENSRAVMVRVWVALLLLLSASVAAGQPYVDPMTTCLNNYVLPNLESKLSAKQLTDDAFNACDKQVNDWLKPFEAIGRRDESYASMHDFYVRMIGIRRKSESKK